MFKKTSAIVHDLLLGMNILKFSEISFIERSIRFKIPQVKKKALLKSPITLRLLSNDLQYNERAATAAKSTETSRIPAEEMNMTTNEKAAILDQRGLHEANNVACRSNQTDPSRMIGHHYTTAELSGGINDIVTSNDIVNNANSSMSKSNDNLSMLNNLSKNNDSFSMSNNANSNSNKLVDDINNNDVKNENDDPKKLDIDLNEVITVPSNSVLISSVSINKKVNKGVNVLLMFNVFKKCVVTLTILTCAHTDCVTLQLANLPMMM